MRLRAAVMLALVSVLVGGVLTGWGVVRWSDRRRQALVEEAAIHRARADSLAAVQRSLRVAASIESARADSALQVADRTVERSRALAGQVTDLAGQLDRAGTVRDSVDLLLAVRDTLAQRVIVLGSEVGSLRSALASEIQASASLRAALTVSDSVLDAERTRGDRLQEAAALPKAEGVKLLGFLPMPKLCAVGGYGATVAGGSVQHGPTVAVGVCL